MADATTAAPAGAAAMDLDMRLLWTVGAVGLYATGTLLNGLRKAWNGAETTNEEAATNAAIGEESLAHEAAEGENNEDGILRYK